MPDYHGCASEARREKANGGRIDISIKIFMADDHKIVRQGLRFLIEKQPDMKVIAEAADGRTTVQMIEKLLPDVVIMDIAMPYMNGIEAARQIIAKNPGTKVIILSMHSDRRFVTEV